MQRRSHSGSRFSSTVGPVAAAERQQRELARLWLAAQGQPQAVIGVLEYWLAAHEHEGATRECD